MKAISLWQPRASLMAAGLKTIETRSWPTGYRGPLAIHAAKHRMGEEEETYLVKWVSLGLISARSLDLLTYGAFVAVVELVDCRPTECGLIRMGNHYMDPGIQEAEFGNYASSRWAWITRNPRAINPPIPWRGKQGLFEVPDGLLG